MALPFAGEPVEPVSRNASLETHAGKRNAPPDGDPTTVLGWWWGWSRRKESNP